MVKRCVLILTLRTAAVVTITVVMANTVIRANVHQLYITRRRFVMALKLIRATASIIAVVVIRPVQMRRFAARGHANILPNPSSPAMDNRFTRTLILRIAAGAIWGVPKICPAAEVVVFTRL